MKAAWPKLPGKKMQNDKKSAKIFMMPESDVVGDDAIMKSSSPRILVGDGASSTPGLTSLGLTITSSPLGDSFCVMSLHAPGFPDSCRAKRLVKPIIRETSSCRNVWDGSARTQDRS